MELAPVALAQVGERVSIAAARSRDGGCLFGRCRGSNRFGSDRHRHDRLDAGMADQSSVIGEPVQGAGPVFAQRIYRPARRLQAPEACSRRMERRRIRIGAVKLFAGRMERAGAERLGRRYIR
jgi:hypothetical protein